MVAAIPAVAQTSPWPAEKKLENIHAAGCRGGLAASSEAAPRGKPGGSGFLPAAGKAVPGALRPAACDGGSFRIPHPCLCCCWVKPLLKPSSCWRELCSASSLRALGTALGPQAATCAEHPQHLQRQTPRGSPASCPGGAGALPAEQGGQSGEEPGRQPLPVPLPAEGNDSP